MPRPRDPDPSPEALRMRRLRERRASKLVSVRVEVPRGDEQIIRSTAERLRKAAKLDG